MTSTGIKSPGTVVTVSGVQTAWGDLTDAKTQNDNGAYAYLGTSGDSSYSEYLRLTNYGLSIPTNARIDGVLATIRCRQTGGSVDVKDYMVRLRKADTTVSDNRASTTGWSTVYVNMDHGSAADKWGFASLSYSDVNNSGFGIEVMVKNNSGINLNAIVDYVGLTVYYTEGEGETPPPEEEIIPGTYHYPDGVRKAMGETGFCWETDDIHVALVGDGYAYSKGDVTYADITDEVTGGGYPAGGVELPSSGRYASYNSTDDLLTFNGANVEFPNITATFRSAIFYINTGGNDDTKPLLCIMSREDNKTVSNANYRLNLEDGIFQIDFSDVII